MIRRSGGRGLPQRRDRPAVLQVGREVANGREPESGHRRSVRRVHRFVQAGAHGPIDHHHAAVAVETPRLGGEGLAGVFHPAPVGHRGAGARRIRRRNTAARSRWRRGLASAMIALARTSPSTGSDRRLEGEALCGRDVELPAQERHGEAALEQKAVAHAPRFGRQAALDGARHEAERLIAPAVHHFQEHRAARARRVLGLEEQQVARVLHQAVGVPRRVGQIHDGAVGRQARVGREVDPGDDAFVGARVVAPADVDADHFGPRRRGGEDQDQPRAARPAAACGDLTTRLYARPLPVDRGAAAAGVAAAARCRTRPLLELPEELDPLLEESLPPREKPCELTVLRPPLDPRAEPDALAVARGLLAAGHGPRVAQAVHDARARRGPVAADHHHRRRPR